MLLVGCTSGSGAGGPQGLQPSLDEGLQRWAKVAACRGGAPRGARATEEPMEGVQGQGTPCNVHLEPGLIYPF